MSAPTPPLEAAEPADDDDRERLHDQLDAHLAHCRGGGDDERAAERARIARP
jgi:hypothetical protein